LRRGLEYGLETTMLPTRMAKQVTAYTPNITKPDTELELAGVGADELSTALNGYHPNGYETNGTPLN
jgi:hypothetical protein